MIRSPYSVFFPLLITFFSYYQTCEDISFDYPSHPYQPFDITHAQIMIDLEMDQHLVNGNVQYSIQSKVNQLGELQLYAADLSIDEVLIDEQEVDFEIVGDAFIIALADTLSKGDTITLSVRWQSTSNFGLHKSFDGTFWSSMNPLAHRHWLPGFDHPREAFTFDATFDIPNDTEVFFNGDLGEISQISTTKKRVQWTSETEVPSTGLGFVVGDFQISEMTAGFTKIRLFHSPSNQQIASDLVVEAARLKKEIENILSFEYPWESLNIIHLSDNFWMERTHGTGTAYVFDRLGNLKHQLARNMYAQWFGEYQRTEQYLNLENEGSNGLLATALHYQFMDGPAQIDNPDSLILIEQWNKWQSSYLIDKEEFKSTIDQSLEGFMRAFDGIVRFEDYAEVWYEQTGVPNFNPAPISRSFNSTDTSKSSSYEVDIYLDELSSELSFYFKLTEGSGDELYSLTLIEHQFDAVTSQEITFTGAIDSVTISVPPTTEFITFESTSIEAEKIQILDAPLFYLLNQLRSENPEYRILAANLLVQHASNPDLQLALSDILAFEENPNVKAAIYLALAAITDGATGTEEQFIRELNNESESIQISALKALQNYASNEYVRSSVQSKIFRSEGAVFKAAAETYTSIASGEELESTLRSLDRRDTVGVKTLLFVQIADSLQFSEYGIQITDHYASAGNPHFIRERALELLNVHDIDAERWTSRIDALVNDRDPRIRFWAVEHIPRFNSASESLVLLNAAEVNEMDPRVLLMINGVKEELAN